MSLEGKGVSASPTSSGRSSPVNPRIRNRDDDVILKKDKGYRRYASGVERVLGLFDSTVEEWADYISFLSRLLKALQVKPSGVSDIPYKLFVAKRLSQCLNPALPPGVHQKALEVYAHIFMILGRDGLSVDLSLYLSGLAPLLSYAALSVKPGVLALFETYVLSIKVQALRPALKSILLALFPGLEEDSSDEFDRSLEILNKIKAIMAQDGRDTALQENSPRDQYFWQCVFLVCITSSSRRAGALAYLARSLPRLGQPLDTTRGILSAEDFDPARMSLAIQAVASPEPGLLIRCFCAGLHDSHLLTQRGFLDLLVTHFPLHSTVLREKVSSDDLDRLVAAAVSVVARRDMSLNRRLWSWFLGPESTSDVAEASNGTIKSPNIGSLASPGVEFHTNYFEQYGLEALVRGIKDIIEAPAESSMEKIRPLRICLSLMDRWEIGGIVVPQIFLPAIQSVWQYQSSEATKDAKAEVLRSANMFFDGVESGLIWTEISALATTAFLAPLANISKACGHLDLIFFIITTFNIKEEEMQTVHIPLVSLTLLLLLQKRHSSDTGHRRQDQKLVILAARIINKLLDLAPPRALNRDSEDDTISGTVQSALASSSTDVVLELVQHFYIGNQGNLDAQRTPISPSHLGQQMLRSAFDLVSSALVEVDQVHAGLDLVLAILHTCLKKIVIVDTMDLPKFWSALLRNSSEQEASVNHPFSLLFAKVTTIETIFTAPKSIDWIPNDLLPRLLPRLVADLWTFLSPSRPKYNVEAVRSIWRLQAISSDKTIESMLTTLMVAENQDHSSPGIEEARRFVTLWIHSPATTKAAHSRRSSIVTTKEQAFDLTSRAELVMLKRPLLLLLDSLGDANAELGVFVTHWLQSLSSLSNILGFLMGALSTMPHISRLLTSEDRESEESAHEDDLETCLYFLELLLRVVNTCSASVWPYLLLPSALNIGTTESGMTNQAFLATMCIKLLRSRGIDQHDINSYGISRTTVSLLRQLLQGPAPEFLRELGLEKSLLDELTRAIQRNEQSLQVMLLDVTITSLRLQFTDEDSEPSSREYHLPPHEFAGRRLLPAMGNERSERILKSSVPTSLSPKLFECLKLGLSHSSGFVLEKWLIFLKQCLPLYGDTIFQNLLPLVACFCDTLESVFMAIQQKFESIGDDTPEVSEPTLGLLLNGLEQSLEAAHERLVHEEGGGTPIKTADQSQSGFFGTMVSGVFAGDSNRSRSATANNRLTVLLCFKDTIRVCFKIWSWGDLVMENPLRDTSASASFNYTSLRLRHRIRRIFEPLFAAEALESLETLIELWHGFGQAGSPSRQATIFDLLHVLENSRPKNTIPAIFNAMYSRSNPSVLDPTRKSTLTSSISDLSLAAFLIAYTRSLDDDVMDEIWTDCMTFLRDVLANPMPHRQTLPRLLEFTAVLGEKVDNTHFGEPRKMRRELGDLFARLLTATLTIRPMTFSQDGAPTTNIEKSAHHNTDRSPLGGEGLVSILASITPNLPKVLIDSDRITSTATTISTQVIAPTIRSKLFPGILNQRTLDLMVGLGNIPEAARSWRRDVGEAFNDSRFFATSSDLYNGWLPILRQWAIADKERMPELFSRLNTPTTAGIMFGVGATSARLEADRKTQLNLRRIAFLILAGANDAFVADLSGLQERLIDLLDATASSSPSSMTRADLYLVVRALVLKTSAVHLASFWPSITSELYDILSSAFPTRAADPQNNSSSSNSLNSLLQAAKLLETLLMLGPEDFQMQSWLFVADTTDAVYRPAHQRSVALVDELAEALDADTQTQPVSIAIADVVPGQGRKPLLTARAVRNVPRELLLAKVLRPFFRQLSIHAFESTYGMAGADVEACREDLIEDLFDDGTLV